MIQVRGICLNSRDEKDYFSVFLIISHGNYRSAKTVYFPAVDDIDSFLNKLSEELQCQVNEITFAPHVNLGLFGILT